jgi:hypothetical protein
MDLHVKVTDQLKEYIIPPTPENVCPAWIDCVPAQALTGHTSNGITSS